MPKKQPLKSTRSKPKKSVVKGSSKKSRNVIKDILADTSTRKSVPRTKPKFPQPTKTVKATTFELNLTLEVTTGTQEIQQPKKRIATLERVIDKKKQMFKAGTATIVLKTRGYALPAERVIGLDAKDVEIVLQLFGLAK